MQNYDSDQVHKIKHIEIQSLIFKSIIIPLDKENNFVCLGKFGNKVYETYVLLLDGNCDVRTCFLSNKLKFIQLYENFEKNNPRK